jgi:hypothetical protein
MSTAAFEYESAVHPAAQESWESEAFLESVAKAARVGKPYRPLALAAMAAARAALAQANAPGDLESEWELEGESEWETSPAAFAQSYLAHEAGPSATLMEHLGHAAAEAESNGEAFAFLAPLLPLALKALPLAGKALGIGAKFLPKVASTVTKLAPKLIKGVNAAAKTLRTNPATKQLVQALPQVVRRTTADLAKQIAGGKRVNANTAVRTLAKQTAQVLGNPQCAVRTLRQAKTIDRRFDKVLANAGNGGDSSPCICQ